VPFRTFTFSGCDLGWGCHTLTLVPWRFSETSSITWFSRVATDYARPGCVWRLLPFAGVTRVPILDDDGAPCTSWRTGVADEGGIINGFTAAGSPWPEVTSVTLVALYATDASPGPNWSPSAPNYVTRQVTLTPLVTTPEPSVAALLAGGLAGVGALGWRRRRAPGKEERASPPA